MRVLRLKSFLRAFLNFLDQYYRVEERIAGMPDPPPRPTAVAPDGSDQTPRAAAADRGAYKRVNSL